MLKNHQIAKTQQKIFKQLKFKPNFMQIIQISNFAIQNNLIHGLCMLTLHFGYLYTFGRVESLDAGLPIAGLDGPCSEGQGYYSSPAVVAVRSGHHGYSHRSGHNTCLKVKCSCCKNDRINQNIMIGLNNSSNTENHFGFNFFFKH